MGQYIDKSKVVEEIEDKINKYTKRGEESDAKRDGYGMYWGGVISCLNEIRSFLDTLEVKDVNLAKELDNYFTEFKALEKNNWNWRIDSINIHAQGIYEFAKYFFELGLKAQKGK